MIGLLALGAVLAAAPAGGVVLTKRGGVSRSDAVTRVSLVEKTLKAYVPSLLSGEDASDCLGKLPCLVQLGRDKKWTALIGVETATVLQDVIVSVRAYSIDEDGKTIDSATVKSTDAGLEGALKAALVPMASKLKTMMQDATPAVSQVPSSPTVAATVPALKTPDVVKTPESPLGPAASDFSSTAASPTATRNDVLAEQVKTTSSGSGITPVARWAPLGISLVVLAAGGVSFALSKGDAAKLRAIADGRPNVSQVEIGAIAGRGNTLQTLGGIGLIGGSVATAGSLAFALLYPHQEQNLAVSVVPTADGAMAGLSGRF